MPSAEVMHLLNYEFGMTEQDEIEGGRLLAIHLGEVVIGAVEPGTKLDLAAAAPTEGLGDIFKRLKLGLNTGACGALIEALHGHPAESGHVDARDSE